MAQMTLYFYFPPKLYSNSIFLELSLEQDFESHDKFGFLFPCKIDMTEFAFTKWFDEFIQLNYVGNRLYIVCFTYGSLVEFLRNL